MTDTDQIREWYYRGVVLNHADRGTPGYEPECNHDHPTLGFPQEGGGHYFEPVHPLTYEAFQAYVTVMRYWGETMPGAGGVNQCRNIGTGDWPSTHAYIVSVDLPPDERKSAKFVTAIARIRTNSGTQVFRTLTSDRMHDQIDCSPADLATGIDLATVAGITEQEMKENMKIPLRSWARSTFKWMIENRFYREQTDLDKVRETLDFQQIMVTQRRMHDAAVRAGSTGDIDKAIAVHSEDPDAHHE